MHLAEAAYSGALVVPARAAACPLPLVARGLMPKPSCFWTAQDLETDYAVSPNTPLLSTEVQENVWVCGELQAETQRGRGRLAASRADRRQRERITRDLGCASPAVR